MYRSCTADDRSLLSPGHLLTFTMSVNMRLPEESSLLSGAPRGSPCILLRRRLQTRASSS